MGIRNSEQLVESEFSENEEGFPTGGTTMMIKPTLVGKASGLEDFALWVNWQDGIIPEGEAQNGAFVEDVIEAARQRLLWFNSRPQSRCRENSLAITKLEEALQWLDWRTRNRVIEGVENTYASHNDGGQK